MEDNRRTSEVFSLRFYSANKSKYGVEFVEFILNNSGLLKYLNSSPFKHEERIKKTTRVSKHVINTIKSLVRESELFDSKVLKILGALQKTKGPEFEEMEIVIDKICFCMTTPKLKTGIDMDHYIQDQIEKAETFSKTDFEEIKKAITIYSAVLADVHNLLISLINIHFKADPYA